MEVIQRNSANLLEGITGCYITDTLFKDNSLNCVSHILSPTVVSVPCWTTWILKNEFANPQCHVYLGVLEQSYDDVLYER